MSIEALKAIKACLEKENERPGAICDTLWFSPCETLFDYIDYAIQQAEAKTDEPVYWEWRHQGSHPDAVDFGQWSEWKRVEPRSALHTVEDALNEFRGYIARGHKYELRALYTHPAPGVPDDVVRDAERYRWLRSLEHCNEAWCFIGSGNANSNLDAAIDAAMLAAAQAQKGGE